MKYFFIPAISLVLVLSQISIVPFNLALIASLCWFIWKNETESLIFAIISGFLLDLLTNIPLGTSVTSFLLILTVAALFKRLGITRKKVFTIVFLTLSLLVWNVLISLILFIADY